jgi:hypothetical protein
MPTTTDPATVPAPPGGLCSHAARAEVSRLFRPEALVGVDIVTAIRG